MARVLIIYSTTDGHTRSICERLQEIAAVGNDVDLVAMADQPGIDIAPYDKVVIGASIRYGKHQKEVFDFIGLKRHERLERVFILGGKQIGIQLAEELEKQRVSVKLFEKDRERCRKISEILTYTIVVNGDGMDAGMLSDENIRGIGAYLALEDRERLGVRTFGQRLEMGADLAAQDDRVDDRARSMGARRPGGHRHPLRQLSHGAHDQ